MATQCPVTREEFRELAGPLTITVEGKELTVNTREFRSDSFGWRFDGKVYVEVGGKVLKCQASIQLVVANSKNVD